MHKPGAIRDKGLRGCHVIESSGWAAEAVVGTRRTRSATGVP